MTRRGKPSNADLAEREQRKEEWKLQQKHRQWMESQIKRGRVDNVLIASPPSSPAMRFLLDRVHGVSMEQLDAAMWQAMIELLSSGIPLDVDIHRLIADVMRARTDSEFAKRCRDRAKFAVITCLLAQGERRGEKPEDVRARLATEFGHNSGSALRVWMDAHKPED